MKILAVDIGTGTQDIFLYDSNLESYGGMASRPTTTMKILTVDIGTGTQDIFLYDSNSNRKAGWHPAPRQP